MNHRTRLVLEFLRLSALSGLVFTVSLVVILLVVGWHQQDRIKSMFLDALNRQLQTEIYVDDIRLELFRSFPLASLTLHGVSLMESGSHQPKDTLLRAGRIQLQFRITDIIRKDYTLKQITISRGFLRAGYHGHDQPNYIFWDQDAPSHEEPLQIDLQRVLLNDMAIRYFHPAGNTLVDLGVTKAVLRGLFQEKTFRMTAVASLYARELTIGDTGILAGQALTLDLDMLVGEQRRFTFNKGEVEVNGHSFALEGSLSGAGEGVWLDMLITGSRLSLQELIPELPDQLTAYLQGYALKGELGFEARVSGPFSRQAYPSLQLSCTLKRGELLHAASGLRLKDLRFSGAFDNGALRSKQTASIRFDELHTRVSSGLIKGQGSVVNLERPYFDLTMLADINATDMVHLFRIGPVDRADGRISIDITFQGGMSTPQRFTGEDLVKARASGSITAKQLGFNLKGKPLLYHGIDGTLVFRNNDLLVESFTGQAGRSDFTISGYFRNVLPYIFLADEPLQVDAHLHARMIDFDELLHDNASEADSTYRLQFSDRLGFHITATADKVSFRKFSATNLSGTMSLHDKRFFAQDLSFRSMDGQVRANGFIDGSRPDRLRTGCDASLHRVDVHQLFAQMGNFGQTSIMDEHIFGIMTSDIRFAANWSPDLQIDWGSLETEAAVRIEDGVLVDYEPMNALGRFLRVDDLSRVTFSTLENMIRIRNRHIIIPQMDIQSNVLNLKLSGEHTFENQIDYYIQVLLSDILARKNRERRNPQEQYGEIIDDGLGRTTLFLRVTGHIDDPVFRYDVQGVRQKIADDLRQERENLRETLRKEFSFLSRPSAAGTDTVDEADTRLRTLRRREMERIRKQEEGKILIEWDEF